MKILHVISDLSPEYGGPVTALTGMARAQTALGHQVSIASVGMDKMIFPGMEGININMYPCRHSGWRWSEGLAAALPSLVSNADIVHIHTVWEYPTYAAAVICKRKKKPYILRPCGMLDKWSLSQSAVKKKIYHRLFARPVISGASAIHFTSKGEAQNSLFCESARGRFTVPIGLPDSAYSDLPERDTFLERFPLLKGKRLVLFLGRLHYKKQPEAVIQSFHRQSLLSPSLHLVIAGTGEVEYVSQLRDLVKELGLESRVTFTGMLDRAAVREAYRAADLFILPSLSENFGISVAEAMAAGCPVIVSENVNLASDIRNASAGIVCKPGIESLVPALQSMIHDESLRKAVINNGRRLIMEKFTWNSLSEKLIDIYRDILGGQRTSVAWETR